MNHRTARRKDLDLTALTAVLPRTRYEDLKAQLVENGGPKRPLGLWKRGRLRVVLDTTVSHLCRELDLPVYYDRVSLACLHDVVIERVRRELALDGLTATGRLYLALQASVALSELGDRRARSPQPRPLRDTARRVKRILQGICWRYDPEQPGPQGRAVLVFPGAPSTKIPYTPEPPAKWDAIAPKRQTKAKLQAAYELRNNLRRARANRVPPEYAANTLLELVHEWQWRANIIAQLKKMWDLGVPAKPSALRRVKLFTPDRYRPLTARTERRESVMHLIDKLDGEVNVAPGTTVKAIDLVFGLLAAQQHEIEALDTKLRRGRRSPDSTRSRTPWTG